MAINLDLYFKEDPKTKRVTFVGDTLEIWIFDSYEKHGQLTISDTVKTLGIFDMVINGKYNVGYLLTATIEIKPREVTRETDDEGNSYVVLHLKKGDTFIERTEIVVLDKLAYVAFSVFVEYGQRYKFMTYDRMANLFNQITVTSGVNIKVDNAIFSALFAHMTRDYDDPMVPYRLTDMKRQPRILALTEVAQSALSTTGKLVGAYFSQGLDSAMAHPAKNMSDIETMLRS